MATRSGRRRSLDARYRAVADAGRPRDLLDALAGGHPPAYGCLNLRPGPRPTEPYAARTRCWAKAACSAKSCLYRTDIPVVPSLAKFATAHFGRLERLTIA